MKGYEFLRLAVFVIKILLIAVSGLPTSGVEARSAHHPKMRCTRGIGGGSGLGLDLGASAGLQVLRDVGAAPTSSESYWLRNSCHNGFVVIKEGHRVLAQHENLDRHNPEVELIKESCVVGSSSEALNSVKTRFYSPASDRYICFSRKGRVVSVKPKQVEKWGNLCAFYERPVFDPQLYKAAAINIQLQSAHRDDWFLGFGPNPKMDGQQQRRRQQIVKGRRKSKHRGIVYTREGHKATNARRMYVKQRDGPSPDAKKCDFLFFTGRFQPEKLQWKGLFDHILSNTDQQVHLRLAMDDDQQDGRKDQLAAAANSVRSRLGDLFSVVENDDNDELVENKLLQHPGPQSHYSRSTVAPTRSTPSSLRPSSQESSFLWPEEALLPRTGDDLSSDEEPLGEASSLQGLEPVKRINPQISERNDMRSSILSSASNVTSSSASSSSERIHSGRGTVAHPRKRGPPRSQKMISLEDRLRQLEVQKQKQSKYLRLQQKQHPESGDSPPSISYLYLHNHPRKVRRTEVMPDEQSRR